MPGFPPGLVQAFNEGRLTLFAGAGVSKDSPSCVPLLGGLADRVAAELGVPSSPDADGGTTPTPVDRLGQYASAGLGVHEAVHKIVSQSAEPNDAHRAVCGLARAMGTIRIVTTNYDRHISACLPEGTRVYEAPDFPGDGDFAGVVHLHGSVDQEPGRLVVTEDDFARSYMQWNSPTLSFLHRLFASQTVLFVGYSVEDTLMQYILRATETSTGIYALTRDPDLSQWGRSSALKRSATTPTTTCRACSVSGPSDPQPASNTTTAGLAASRPTPAASKICLPSTSPT